MQIKNLQINGFGKLKDVNVNLKEGLNLIMGENESGKSTFTEFIKGIFYGVSRNKNGKEYSDYEKFKPWNDRNFSGKLVYTLGEEEYVVYRDFNHNNAKVYNKNGLDITNEFNKDKSRGSEIGLAHLGMDEDTFDNSIFIKQKEIKVNEVSQNTILQKLTNMIQSGDEDVSYETTLKKLEKILLEEVGTDRTQNKPKNVYKREIVELELKESQLLANRAKHEEIEKQLKDLNEKKSQSEKNLADIIKIFNIKNKYETMIQTQKSEFDIEKKIRKEQEKKLENVNQRKKIIDTTLIIMATAILAVAFALTNEILLAVLVILAGIISIVINFKLSYKEEISVSSDNFDVVSEEARKKEKKELNDLEKEGVKKSLTEKSVSELKSMLEKYENEKKEYLLEEHKLKLEDEMLEEKLSDLVEIEEELSFRKDKLNEVLKKESTINFAISKLKEAYQELKDEVIPDVEKDIKYTIAKTTNGKYTNVKYNDYDGLLVENQLGQLIKIDKLSVGTIDQMYLGFRMAIADKYSDIPMVFDETFVFCDDIRLTNILKTLSQMAEERQIILLSCSSREEKILETLNANYSKINLNN